jgi:hypothetical protein
MPYGFAKRLQTFVSSNDLTQRSAEEEKRPFMTQLKPARITVKSRPQARLRSNIEKNLLAYAAAATAAGVGVLACPPMAEGKIVYTPAHVNLQGGTPFSLDLNHDGKVDFFLLLGGSVGAGGTAVGALSACHRPFRGTKGYICVSSTGASNSLNAVRITQSGREVAAALRAGAKIENGDRFQDKVAVAMGDVVWETFTSVGTRWSGAWVNGGKGVKNRYLGLKFEIDGKFHFGWARLTVTTTGKHDFTATLTGYAYETVPGKSIIAGKTHGKDAEQAIDASAGAPEPATLGMLALGAPGLLIWRRDEHSATTR